MLNECPHATCSYNSLPSRRLGRPDTPVWIFECVSIRVGTNSLPQRLGRQAVHSTCDLHPRPIRDQRLRDATCHRTQANTQAGATRDQFISSSRPTIQPTLPSALWPRKAEAAWGSRQRIVVGSCQGASSVPGVHDTRWLNKHGMNLSGGNRAVLGPPWDDEELPLL